MSDFEQEYGEQIIVPVRIAFACLDKPDTGHRYSTNRYGFTAIVSKQDEATLQAMIAALCNVAQVSSLTEMVKHPFMDKQGRLRDGDTEGYKNKEGLAGTFHFKCSSKNPIRTLSAMVDGDPVDCSAGELYNGCYCAAVLTPALYDEGMTTFYPSALIMVDHGPRFTSVAQVDPVQAFRNWSANPAGATPAPAAAPVAKEPVQQEAPATPAATAPAAQAMTASTEAPQQRRRGRPAGTGTVAKEPPTGTGEAAASVMNAMAAGVKPAPTQATNTVPNGRGQLSDLLVK